MTHIVINPSLAEPNFTGTTPVSLPGSVPGNGNASEAGDRLSKLAKIIIDGYLPPEKKKAAHTVLASALVDWALNEPDVVEMLADLITASRETLADYSIHIHEHNAQAVLVGGMAGLVLSCNMRALAELGEAAVLEAARDACDCVDRFILEKDLYGGIA